MNPKDCDKKVEAMIETLWNDAIDNEHGDCDECAFSQRMTQSHPLGATSVTETWGECQVPDAKDCPVVEQITAAMYNVVMTVTKKEAP